MPTTSTEYGRAKIFWPDFGHDGGTTLHSKVVGTFADKYGVETISDYLPSVWYGAITLANSATQNFVHNFTLAVSEVTVLIWESAVLRTAAQVAAAYTIAQVDTATISVTNISGGSKTFDIMIIAARGVAVSPGDVLEVKSGTGKGIDAGTSGVLPIGGTVATTLLIGRSGQTIQFLGNYYGNQVENLGLDASVSGNALTIALKQADGSTNPTSTAPVRVAFRGTTNANGDYTYGTATAATSLVVSSGSTLGTESGVTEYLYVYALNNAGTIELAVSRKKFNDDIVDSTTAEGGAGAADSDTTMYSTTARSNVGLRLIGRIVSNQATAGTWATDPSVISVASSQLAVNPYKTFYKEVTYSVTFNATTGVSTASSSCNLVIKRDGSFVFFFISRPTTGVTITSGAPTFVRASLTLPTWARPTTQFDLPIFIRDSNDSDSDNDRRGGLIEIDNVGNVDLYKNIYNTGGFSNSSTVNWITISGVYYIG